MKYPYYLKAIILSIVILINQISLGDKIIEPKKFNIPDDIAFLDENSNPHFFTEFDDKTILITFWATWCSACAKEIPNLDILQKDFRKLPFEVIPLSEDFQGIDVIKDYYKTKNIHYLKIYHDKDNKLYRAFEIAGLPTALLVNHKGEVVLEFKGYINWNNDNIRKLIFTHIKGDYTMPKNSYKEPLLQK